VNFGAYRSLLEGEHATTDLTVGVVKFRETYEYYIHSQEGTGGSVARKLAIEEALRHEMIHVIQSVTTSAVFSFSENMRFLLSQLVKYRLQGAEWSALLPEARKEYRRNKDWFEAARPVATEEGMRNISVQQIFEDMAIVETINSMQVTPREQMERILEATPRDASYGRCMGMLMRVIGPAGALKLAPAVYFVCLNSDDPVEAFSRLLGELYEIPYSFLDSLGAGDALEFIFGLLKADWSSSLISSFASGANPSASPMWNHIGYMFATSGPIELTLRVAAYPSSLLAESNWSKSLDSTRIAAVTPPLTIWSDGVALLSQAVPQESLQTMLEVMSISGALFRLLEEEPPFVACQLRFCPVRMTGLCHNHMPPPPESDWKDCSFLGLAQELFDRQPEELADFVCAALQQARTGEGVQANEVAE